MKLKLIYTLSFLFLILLETKAQVESLPTYRNIFFLEAGGIGAYGSLNFEKIHAINESVQLGIRVGVGTYKLTDFRNQINPDLILPVGAKLLYGRNHKMVLGIGQSLSYLIEANPSNGKPQRKASVHSNFTIGYRYLKTKGGILFACSYTPIIESNKTYRHWAGISIGYAFK